MVWSTNSSYLLIRSGIIGKRFLTILTDIWSVSWICAKPLGAPGTDKRPARRQYFSSPKLPNSYLSQHYFLPRTHQCASHHHPPWPAINSDTNIHIIAHPQARQRRRLTVAELASPNAVIVGGEAPTPRGVLSDKGAESALSRHQISYSTPCILHILSTIALHSYLLNIDHCLNADHRHHDCFVILVLLLSSYIICLFPMSWTRHKWPVCVLRVLYL